MQQNGGYFGSMVPFMGSSFMPGMGSNPAAIGGVSGAPDASGLTNPPNSPNITALLAALSKMSQSQQGQTQGNLPPNSYSPYMQGGGQPASAPGQQPGQQPGGAPGAGGPPGGGAPGAGGAPQLTPAMLQQLLQKLGIGGGGAAPAAL